MPTIPGYRLFRHLFIDTGAPAYLAWVRLRLKTTGGITLTATPDADGLGGELAITGSGVWSLPAHRSTNYRAAGVVTATATAYSATASFTPAIGDVHAYPILECSDATINTVGLRVTTPAVGGRVRIALYEDNGNGYPGALVGAAVEIDVTSSGDRTASTGGWARSKSKRYWLTSHYNATAMRFACVPSGNFYALGYTAPGAGKPYIGWFKGIGAYSANAPNPFTASASENVPSSNFGLPIYYKS